MARILGLDVGDRRIGVAVSDPSMTLATPLKTIIRQSDEKTYLEILTLLEKLDVEKIVIGLPYSLDGTIGKQAEKVIKLRDELSLKTDVAIIMQDERLSSVTANERLREAGKKGTKLKNQMDAAAATVILQCFLDSCDQESSK